MSDNVIDIDDYRAIEDIAKIRLRAKNVIFVGELEDGNFISFIPDEVLDIDLVYMIQTLKDRRSMRLQE